MENESIFYYDGTGTRAIEVRVLLYNEQLHVLPLEDFSLELSFAFSGMSLNQINDTVFLYLDKTATKYLTYPVNHTLAGNIRTEVRNQTGNVIQRLMRQRGFVLLGILCLLAVALYFTAVNLIPVIGARLISVQQEIELGDNLKNVTLQQETMVGNKVDPINSKLLQQFADLLELSSKYPIRITLLNSGIVNAYALPGGNIVVYTGILQKIKTPEQLVALLAHESTHINERHTLRSMLRRTADAIIISILFGDASGIVGAVASKAETLNSLRYSRSLESEADSKGMELMVANQVEVDGMIQLLKMLEVEDKLSPSLAFFSSHPLTKERLSAANKWTSVHGRHELSRSDLTNAFLGLKRRVKPKDVN